MNVEKYRRTGQATYDNMAHAHYIQDTDGYKHIICTCNTSCCASQCYVIRTLPALLKLLPGSLAFKD